MIFGQSMDVDDPKVDPEGQGHRSRSPIKKRHFGSHLTVLDTGEVIKDH